MNKLYPKAVNRQRFHPATVVLHCFEECLTNFVVNLLPAESGTIYPLQWVENCSTHECRFELVPFQSVP
jgi:hypothetical protein